MRKKTKDCIAFSLAVISGRPYAVCKQKNKSKKAKYIPKRSCVMSGKWNQSI